MRLDMTLAQRFRQFRPLTPIALTVLLLTGAALSVEWMRGHVRLAWNETESLPSTAFVVFLDVIPQKGDLVFFHPPEALRSPYPFIKRVAGVPGDEVKVVDRTVFINGLSFGVVKPASRRGESLTPIASGVIPPGSIFVHADHRDSYDSRYQSIGLVPDARIIGRAIALF